MEGSLADGHRQGAATGSPASFKMASGGGKRKPRATGILFTVLAAFIILSFLFALYSFSHRHPPVRLEDYSKFATGMSPLFSPHSPLASENLPCTLILASSKYEMPCKSLHALSISSCTICRIFRVENTISSYQLEGSQLEAVRGSGIFRFGILYTTNGDCGGLRSSCIIGSVGFCAFRFSVLWG